MYNSVAKIGPIFEDILDVGIVLGGAIPQYKHCGFENRQDIKKREILSLTC